MPVLLGGGVYRSKSSPQDNMPCSVYRWQLRLRAHNMRERAVSYTASDEAWMGILGWKVAMVGGYATLCYGVCL